MLIQATFGAAQSALGYQFYGADGTLLGSRVTSGISALPETGAYIADATVPSGAAGVYWNDTTSGATAIEDLREALSSPSVPSAAAIADAVWDEALAGHATAGSAGAGLTAAGAAGDPWASTVPGSYADGTAGAALGRLNNTPADEPVLVLPEPPADAALTNLYIYTEAIDNTKRAGITLTIKLATTPAKSERVLEKAAKTMTTNADGYAILTVQRNVAYRVTSTALGLNTEFTPTTELFDLADLIS